MIKGICSLAVAALFLSALASAEVREEWVARYSGSGNDNYLSAMVLDPQGNIYVTGGSIESTGGRSYATVKYDSSGNQLWAANYQGPARGDDYANAIAVDSAGNVYVTGQSLGDGTNYDYVTIKYDANGNQLWVARYNGPSNSVDYGRAIAVDGSGNVYVTGRSDDPPTSIAFTTVKYDADGNEIWVDRYNYSGGVDSGTAIAVDPDGNIYVTGQSTGVGTGPDYATIKYDTDGNRLWVARYDGPGSGRDFTTAIALDASRNIYVTGQSWGGSTFDDYATVKYDNDGNQVWVARYDGPGHYTDGAFPIAVDGAGIVYVSGSSSFSLAAAGFATVKYDASGNQDWVARYDLGPPGQGGGAAITLDSSGNSYVTGTSLYQDTGFDFVTIKYDGGGNQIWFIRYNGPGNSLDTANSIAIDGNRNVFVGGTSMGATMHTDFAIVKYSQTN